MTFWWCYRGGQDGPPYTIEVVEVGTAQEACAAFRERFPSPCVHVLTTPALVEAARQFPPGLWHPVTVEALPTSRDHIPAHWR